MYFFYFDESGSRDPSIGTVAKPKDHLYVLLAAVVGIISGLPATSGEAKGAPDWSVGDHARRAQLESFPADAKAIL